MRRGITKPQYTEANVPLRREFLGQPVLFETLFSRKIYPLPFLTEGQHFRVYDADNWQRDNGKEGTLRRYHMLTGLYIGDVNGREEPYYGREIMKIR